MTGQDSAAPPLERRWPRGLPAEVSAIGAGCWTIGGPAINDGVPIGWDDVNPDDAYAGLARAHELGVTLFDTADVYGLGRSERLLGRLLRTVSRSSVVVSSKVGYFAGTAPHPYQPAQMRHQFATSLHNLGTDHLDIYHLHSTDFGPEDHYLPGALHVLHDLRTQGLIHAIGMRAPHTFAEQWATTDRPEAAPTARWLRLFHAIQPTVLTVRYNLLSPLYQPEETDIFTFARRHGVGVLIKQALGQGTLLRYTGTPPPTYSRADHRSRDRQFQPDALTALDARLARLRARFGDHPTAQARIALRYALHRDPDATVLVGFRNATQIDTIVTCLGDPLRPDEIAEIHAVLHPTTV